MDEESSSDLYAVSPFVAMAIGRLSAKQSVRSSQHLFPATISTRLLYSDSFSSDYAAPVSTYSSFRRADLLLFQARTYAS